MKVKFTTFHDSKNGDIIGLGGEINLGGEKKRAMIAFHTDPSKTDLEKARDELKRWAKFQRDKHQHHKREWLKSFRD